MIGNIDRLNFFLVLMACAVACLAPFGLLVVAYAVLGPLHYLTEILWLEDRQCFLPKRQDSRWLTGLCLAGVLAGTVTALLAGSDAIWAPSLAFHTQQIAVTAALLAVASPLVLWKFSGGQQRLVALSAVGVVGSACYYVYDAYSYFLLLAVLLPTVVHVYIFTGAFMLSGAIKSRSSWGLGAVVLLVCCGAGLVLFDLPSWLLIETRLASAYELTLGHVHRALAGWLPWKSEGSAFEANSILSPTGIRLSRFLAFAYTYHYLNWFSKTSLIGWHRRNLIPWMKIAGLWAACVMLYIVNYEVGLTVVGVLSLLHVFYELPLNWLSIGALVGQIQTRLGRHTEVPSRSPLSLTVE